MRADLLHVVTAYANPQRYLSRKLLFDRFARHMAASGVPLTVVECAYGDRSFELADTLGITHVGVRARSLVWEKERQLNAGIARLPQGWKYVAWVDADIVFRNPTWAADTVHALQQYDVVQPWTTCYDLGPSGEHLELHRSFCRQWILGEPVGHEPYAAFAHPGYAWAATRGALDALGGLVDTAALGAADHHMALALVGRAQDTFPGSISAGYQRPILQWQDRARQHVAGNIGAVSGTIEHEYHGAKALRRYVDRWTILTRNDFDPDLDLKTNVWGMWELAGNKPALSRDINAYFAQREEDATTLSAARELLA